MKKLVLFAAVVAMMSVASCGFCGSSQGEATDSVQVDTLVVDTVQVDTLVVDTVQVDTVVVDSVVVE